MAWTPVEWVAEAVVVWLTVLFLKSVKGYLVSTEGDRVCTVPKCYRKPGADPKYRGMCLTCYSQAKKRVDEGRTTWNRLAEMGLCTPESSPFDDAYTKATEGE